MRSNRQRYHPDVWELSGHQHLRYSGRRFTGYPFAGQNVEQSLNDVNDESFGNLDTGTDVSALAIQDAIAGSPTGAITLFLFSGGAQSANTAWLAGEIDSNAIDYVVYVSPGFGFGQTSNILMGTKGTFWISNPIAPQDLLANEGVGTQFPIKGITYLSSLFCFHSFTCMAQHFSDLFNKLNGPPCSNPHPVSKPWPQPQPWFVITVDPFDYTGIDPDDDPIIIMVDPQ